MAHGIEELVAAPFAQPEMRAACMAGLAGILHEEIPGELHDKNISLFCGAALPGKVNEIVR